MGDDEQGDTDWRLWGKELEQKGSFFQQKREILFISSLWLLMLILLLL